MGGKNLLEDTELRHAVWNWRSAGGTQAFDWQVIRVVAVRHRVEIVFLVAACCIAASAVIAR